MYLVVTDSLILKLLINRFNRMYLLIMIGRWINKHISRRFAPVVTSVLDLPRNMIDATTFPKFIHEVRPLLRTPPAVRNGCWFSRVWINSNDQQPIFGRNELLNPVPVTIVRLMEGVLRLPTVEPPLTHALCAHV